MTPALLLDEMLTPTIADQLQKLGHDVLCVIEDPRLRGLPDDQILTESTASGRCLVTLNIGDFSLLHADRLAQGEAHGGLLYVSSATFPQDRGFIGHVVLAIDAAIRTGAVPTTGQAAFLSKLTGG